MNLEVEAIVAKRFNLAYKRIQYKVKWKYLDNESTWEPRNNLKSSSHLVEEFDGGKLPYIERQDSAVSEHSQDQEQINSFANSQKPKRGRPPKKNKNLPVSIENNKKVLPEVSVQSKPAKKRGRPRKHKSPEVSDQLSSQKSFQESEPKVKNLRKKSFTDKKVFEERQIFEEEKDFTVLKGSFIGKEFMFLVDDKNIRKEMTREELYREHPRALIDFYQSHLQIEYPEGQSNYETPKRNPYRRK